VWVNIFFLAKNYENPLFPIGTCKKKKENTFIISQIILVVSINGAMGFVGGHGYNHDVSIFC
jgi:hypothetical protein